MSDRVERMAAEMTKLGMDSYRQGSIDIVTTLKEVYDEFGVGGLVAAMNQFLEENKK